MLLILQYWIKINYLGGKNEGGAVAAAEPGAGTVVWPQQAAEWAAAALSNGAHPASPRKKRRHPRDAAEAISSRASPAGAIRPPAPTHASSCSARTRVNFRRTAKGARPKIHLQLAKAKSDKQRAGARCASINATKSALWCCSLAEPPPNPYALEIF